jgi:hypothetical protein
MRRRRDEGPVWGETGGDRERSVWPLIAGGGLLAVAATVGLSFLMAALLRAGIAGGTPLRTVACLGGLMFTVLCTAIVLVRAAARRFAVGSTARNAVTVGGFAVVMGCAPLLMILVMVLLARGG